MYRYIHTYIHTYTCHTIPKYRHTYVHTYIHTYTSTYMQTFVPTARQQGRQTRRHARTHCKQTGRQTEAGRQAGTQAAEHGQTDRQAGRQARRQAAERGQTDRQASCRTWMHRQPVTHIDTLGLAQSPVSRGLLPAASSPHEGTSRQQTFVISGTSHRCLRRCQPLLTAFAKKSCGDSMVGRNLASHPPLPL